MSLYLIDYSIPLPGESKYNATIARMDVVKTFLSAGATFINWHPITMVQIPKLRGLLWRIGDIYNVWKDTRCLKEGDEVYFQYPYLGTNLQRIIKAVHSRKAKVTLLVHDVEFLRGIMSVSQQEMRTQVALLNSADCLLVHTPQMRERLQQCGVTTQMKPLMLFDYYAKDDYRDIEEQTADKNVIAFAGNLNKSAFLRPLDASTIPPSCTYHFYGVKPETEFHNDRIKYQGKFSPEHTGTIHAGWGLVWDGDGIDTCSGMLGEYLQMIAPHKLSLYIASGIPVIVWSKSAHAQFVKDNNIGIVVDSLNDIYNIITNISNETYKQMVYETRTIGDQLRRGGYLKSLIIR